jgi:Ser/Thr protein kinase RdoA (MazF antagonist)
MEPLAQLLMHLQTVALPDLPVYGVDDIAIEIESGARWLARIVPHLAPRLNVLRGGITSRLATLDDRLLTCHGDFYDDQVLISTNGLAIIDLDEMRLSHPLLDVGNMLAHLTVADARGDDVGAARDAFLTAVRKETRWPENEIALFETLAVLKLAPEPFRRLEPDWVEGIERTLELAEACFERTMQTLPRATVNGSHGGSTDGPVDPALPQLRVLQDPVTMSEKLADAIGEVSVDVTGIQLVRHKPGRRAVLRYEFNRQSSSDPAGSLLYAKTFASGRGPRVYEISQQICSAEAFGPRVSLPEPLAYLPNVQLLVQKPVPGAPVQAALLAGDVDLASKIATALHHFHISSLDLGRAHNLTQELSPLAMRTEQVIARCPELRNRIEFCLRRIHEIAETAIPWRWQPVHRDFYHAQVLIDDGSLAVLDLDDAAMSEPAIDVANFVAHLILLEIEHQANGAVLGPVTHSFVSAYERLDSNLDSHLIRFLTATTLLRLAGIHVSRSDGERLATALLERAEDLLAVEMPVKALL